MVAARIGCNKGAQMGLRYENLDGETRRLMLEEIDADAAGTGFYLSNYLNEAGQEQWPSLLREAARTGSDDELARALRDQHCFKREVERRKPKGGFTMVAVPITAPETLSQSQFNAYYMRALGRRASESGQALTVYRAKAVENPRSESERMIGTQLDPGLVLEVLRRTKGVEPEIGIPMPNSGLTVRLT